MRIHYNIRKVLIFLLCVAMILPETAWAAQTGMLSAETEAAAGAELLPETEEQAEAELPESEFSADPDTFKENDMQVSSEISSISETESIPESEKQEGTDFLIEKQTETEIEKETETEKKPRQVTGFTQGGGPVAESVYLYYDKPSLEQAAADLPETLEVYLDGESETTPIPVTWECVGDYENSSFFYYQFDPVWDQKVYPLSTEQEKPYAAVKFVMEMQMRRLAKASANGASESADSNELEIFQYLTGQMGLNAAAASGIMANIYCESAFYADIEENTTSTNKGYGLCQWTGSRRTDLTNYCTKNNLNYKTVNGQMQFLEYELTTSYTSLLTKLQNTANTKQGAYEAGYNWCYYFERPYNYANVSITRGNLARDSYWPVYSVMPTGGSSTGAFLKIVGQSEPGTMSVGSSFPIRGTVSSSANITSVTVGVYDANNKMKIGKTVQPGVKLYSLVNVDEDIVFSKLTAGSYYYRVTAVSAAGSKTLVNKVFHVLANGRTVADGVYELVSSCSSSYLAAINKSSSNLELAAKSSGGNTRFRITHKSGGYYTIQNTDTGKYIYVESQSSSASAKVYGASSYTLWQILPTGKGTYCIVPQCATGFALDVANGKAAAGQNIQNHKANLTNAQCWTLQKAADQVPALRDKTVPGTLTVGDSFSIRGKLTCQIPMKSVTVGVYDAGGKMKIGKTANPSAESYDLQNLDSSIVFGKLAAGVYRYRVTVVTDKGTTYPVDKRFAVLSKSKTAANGNYQLLSAKNNQYDAGVSGDSKVEGASVVLNAKKVSSFQTFTLTYQSNGYYKIQNSGSGKYLTVASQASASGTNVTLTAAGTLWQVLPDGYGNYYLVPKCATECCLDVKGGTIAQGQNIQIYTGNLTAAQRWKLSADSLMTISGHSLPGALTKGEGFGITGKINASQKLTSVTVGVYDGAGKMKIGKTVSPNAFTYDLANVDYDIRFGQLSPGGYIYKITAAAGGTTKTLASKAFVVKANAATVNNGTYRIVSTKNTGYDLIVSGSSKTSGAALTLIKASGNNSEKYKFTHQGSGNYKIQNVNSGLFLTSEKQSSAKGTKIIQSSSAALWQVLPDGNGAYYLVPSFNADVAIDLSGGVVENGRKIQLYTNNGTPSQRWLLK